MSRQIAPLLVSVLLCVFCAQHLCSFTSAINDEKSVEKLLLAEDTEEEEESDDSEEKDLEDDLDKILCPFDQCWGGFVLLDQQLPPGGSGGYHSLSIPIQLPPPEYLV